MIKDSSTLKAEARALAAAKMKPLMLSRINMIRAKGAMLSTLHAAQARGFRLKCRCGSPARLVGGRRICTVDALHDDPMDDIPKAMAELEDSQRLHVMRRQMREVEVYGDMRELMRRHGRA